MRRVVVMGIGNRLMRDDGIALEVLEYLKKPLEKRTTVEVIIGETDYPFCLSVIKEDDYLIIIDAFYSGNILEKIPGDITLLPLEDVMGKESESYFQHDMGFLDVIRFYPKINGYLVGIEIAEVGFGLDLSTALKERFPDICTMVENQILELIPII